MAAQRGVALLGCAHPHVADALGVLGGRDDVRLRVVWDHDEARARRTAADGNADFSTDVAATLRREDVHLALVMSETKHHEALVPAVLQRGLPLFVEKPLACTPAAARALARDIASSPAPFHMGYFLRDVPVHAALRAHLRQARLGRLLRATLHFGHPGMQLGFIDRTPWLRDRDLAGFGGFGDLGVHLIDLLGWLTGEIPRAGAAALSRPPGAALETHGVALVHASAGWTAVLSAGWTDPVMRISVELVGTDALVRIVDGAVVDAAGSLEVSDFPAPQAPAAGSAIEAFLDACPSKAPSALVAAADAAEHCAILDTLRASAQWE